ncbi:hypothetical protein Cgig2_022310 [Carnegiea gigantea]|uniref:Reverse transcriptase domain-containing protein n=1 Tax=Carnegiea gigantea TaxID=171969 RepID=A0A9Q1JN74_9CARY|nr:hypothetical protein Cgig2_022310 [Carnegiea gigantea]
MPEKSSKLSRPNRKLKTASLPHELNGMRNKRNPLVLVTRKRKALRTEFLYYLDKRPRKDEERVRCFHTTPRNILVEIKGNPMLRRLRPIETPAKFKNKNKYCDYHEDYEHTTFECCELKRALHNLADQNNSTASREEEKVGIVVVMTQKEREMMMLTAIWRL